MRTFVTPGSPPTRAADVLLDLRAQRAAAGGQRDLDVHHAVGIDACALGHAELDDVEAQLGVDHPAEQTP